MSLTGNVSDDDLLVGEANLAAATVSAVRLFGLFNKQFDDHAAYLWLIKHLRGLLLFTAELTLVHHQSTVNVAHPVFRLLKVIRNSGVEGSRSEHERRQWLDSAAQRSASLHDARREEAVLSDEGGLLADGELTHHAAQTTIHHALRERQTKTHFPTCKHLQNSALPGENKDANGINK